MEDRDLVLDTRGRLGKLAHQSILWWVPTCEGFEVIQGEHPCLSAPAQRHLWTYQDCLPQGMEHNLGRTGLWEGSPRDGFAGNSLLPRSQVGQCVDSHRGTQETGHGAELEGMGRPLVGYLSYFSPQTPR